MKQNITTKLRDSGIPLSVAQEFVSDIFGRRVGDTYEEGLVDSNCASEFDSRLQNCQDSWNARESLYQRPDQPSFFEYFVQHFARTIRHTMLKDIRTAVGLGSPPTIFTTNSSESLNASLKKKMNFKETEWPEFNEAMKTFVTAQRDDIIRAVSGRGQYRLTQDYAYLSVTTQKWINMNSEQRKNALARFDSAKVKCHTVVLESLASTDPIPGTSCNEHLSITAEESGISLPFVTLSNMWKKAEEYLNASNLVLPAPGGNIKSKMVASRSGTTPHFVQAMPSGQYACDKNCIQWSSSHICSHTLVVAEVKKELDLFLRWYNGSDQEPNITKLAQVGLPSGRGRKGGVSKRKRCRKSAGAPDVVVPRPAVASYSTPMNTSYSNLPTGVTGTNSSTEFFPTAAPTTLSIGNFNPPSCAVNTDPSTTIFPTLSIGNFNPPSCAVNTDPSTTIFPTLSIGNFNPPSCAVNTDPSTTIFPTAPTTLSIGNFNPPVNTKRTGATISIGNYNSPPSAMGASSLSIPANIMESIVALGASVHQNQTQTNPFYLRLIEGNIRICQGCRKSLRNANGTIPAPPSNLCVARLERRSFFDQSGTLRLPKKEQPSHYHARVECIRAVCAKFVPSTLQISYELRNTLDSVHKEYILGVFGVTV